MTGNLFEEPGAFDRGALAARLETLATRNVFIGASSWKYEGWMGQIYSRERYVTRGRFSRRLFEAECLREYAETFPAVCGDFAFYQFPTPEFWSRLFAQTPPNFRFAFKAPEQITCKVFPTHPRYGSLGGRENELFLDNRAFKDLFLRPLAPFGPKTALIIFEFGAFSRKAFDGLPAFLERLDPFLASLPPEFRYAVEVRNPEYLAPEYFTTLSQRGAAHVYNAWSRMPELQRQIALPGSATAPHMVCRALLRYGRAYEEAVAKFAPYAAIHDPNPEARDAMRDLIARAQDEGKALFLFVNNRLEGNAPTTIQNVID
jgi:uncharacterized protein YecE (DUF72 family)